MSPINSIRSSLPFVVVVLCRVVGVCIGVPPVILFVSSKVPTTAQQIQYLLMLHPFCLLMPVWGAIQKQLVCPSTMSHAALFPDNTPFKVMTRVFHPR